MLRVHKIVVAMHFSLWPVQWTSFLNAISLQSNPEGESAFDPDILEGLETVETEEDENDDNEKEILDRPEDQNEEEED